MTAVLGEQLSRIRTSAGHSAIYFSTIVAAQVTSLVLLPILTRYLGPDVFGQYSLVLAVTGLLGTLGSTWIRTVGMRLYFDYVADARTRSFFWTAAVLQALLMSGVLLVAYPFVRLAGNAIPFALYAWAGISVVTADFYALAANTLRAAQRARQFGAAEWTISAVRLGATWVGLALGFRTATTLFVLMSASALAASVVAWLGLRRSLTGPPRLDTAMARELVTLGLPAMPGSFGSWVIALSDRVLIAYFLDVRAVGIYSAAYGIADRAVNGLASGLYMSTGPVMLRRWAEAREAASRTVSGCTAVYIALSLGPSLLLILQRDFVLRLLAGPEFTTAADVIPWVIVGTWLSGLSVYLHRPLELVKRYSQFSMIAGAAAVLNVALNLVLIPLFGVAGAAAGTFGAFAGFALASRWLGQRAVDVPLPWRTICVSVAAAVAAAIASMTVQNAWVSSAVFLTIYFSVVGFAWWRARTLELHWL